ncbi:MAG TPA: hypothetical protein VF120_12530 [Ktedonobacterales bacterium]
MSDERRAPYLHIVGRGGTAGDNTSGGSTARAVRAGSEGATADATAGGAESGMAQALMYACASWVALVREETAQNVDRTPTGQLSY